MITREAKTRRGLFTTHQVGDRLYFEIPASEHTERYLRTKKEKLGHRLKGL